MKIVDNLLNKNIIILSLLQPPLPILFAAPLTGYLLQYNVFDNTSMIELSLNTSYTLDSVPSGALYNITVSALSDVGPSRNDPLIQLGETFILHE